MRAATEAGLRRYTAASTASTANRRGGSPAASLGCTTPTRSSPRSEEPACLHKRDERAQLRHLRLCGLDGLSQLGGRGLHAERRVRREGAADGERLVHVRLHDGGDGLKLEVHRARRRARRRSCPRGQAVALGDERRPRRRSTPARAPRSRARPRRCSSRPSRRRPPSRRPHSRRGAARRARRRRAAEQGDHACASRISRSAIGGCRAPGLRSGGLRRRRWPAVRAPAAAAAAGRARGLHALDGRRASICPSGAPMQGLGAWLARARPKGGAGGLRGSACPCTIRASAAPPRARVLEDDSDEGDEGGEAGNHWLKALPGDLLALLARAAALAARRGRGRGASRRAAARRAHAGRARRHVPRAVRRRACARPCSELWAEAIGRKTAVAEPVFGPRQLPGAGAREAAVGAVRVDAAPGRAADCAALRGRMLPQHASAAQLHVRHDRGGARRGIRPVTLSARIMATRARRANRLHPARRRRTPSGRRTRVRRAAAHRRRRDAHQGLKPATIASHQHATRALVLTRSTRRAAVRGGVADSGRLWVAFIVAAHDSTAGPAPAPRALALVWDTATGRVRQARPGRRVRVGGGRDRPR